jgi:hypothetical protein
MWALLVPGFHEASPRHTLPCTLVDVLIDEATWSGFVASILVGAEPSITVLVEVEHRLGYTTQSVEAGRPVISVAGTGRRKH